MMMDHCAPEPACGMHCKAKPHLPSMKKMKKSKSSGAAGNPPEDSGPGDGAGSSRASTARGVTARAWRACSFQNAAIAIFVGYMAMVVSVFRGVLFPTAGLVLVSPETGQRYPTVDPMWQRGTLFDVEVVLLPRAAWVSFCLRRHDAGANEQDRCVVTSLVKHLEQPEPRPKRYLVKDFAVLGAFVPDDPEETLGVPATGSNTTVGFWKPLASAAMVTDWTKWPLQTSPREVIGSLQLGRGTRQYLPVIYTDQLGLTKEKLIQINTTNSKLPLEIVVGPMSVSRWQFNALMEQVLKQQLQMGASEQDTDDLRHMLTETEPTLLAVTMTVSLLHVLLDVLAFSSDISFWSNTKSTKGLSVRALFTDLVTQVIITAFLHDQDASLLVLGPCVVGVLIQVWKVRRAWAIGGGEATAALDTTATNTMILLLLPLVVAYSMYSLVRDKHHGFYSWAVSSLASSVYAFGFVMMTPQIFINYKLKSVAHLPWKFFVYRAMNTFIDDLFAFIIRMPAMHRAAAFRDDIIFFIYLYQRWIYPVDHSRVESFDQDGEP
ncbi:CLPTM1-like membrane protein cnrB, partial [Durusdinium trenchii]